jgi:hypothetical protein
LFALGVLAFLACKDKDHDEDDNQFREDVIQCEEAIARLSNCCPGFDGSRVLCNYYYSFDNSGCGPAQTEHVNPALNLSESQCVRDTSCEDLVGNDVCKRAQEARTYSSSVASDNSKNVSDSHPPVCP